MFSLPARASDAGPDSASRAVTCAVCGQIVPRDCTVPCQGSDECYERICEDCQELGHQGSSYRCDGCHLYACPEHMVSDGDMRWCGICRTKEAQRYCPRCDRSYDLAHNHQIPNWAWKLGPDGEFVRIVGGQIAGGEE